MTLASTKNSFLRKHGDRTLIHHVRFGHSVPLTMIVDVYDILKAEEQLPKRFDFPIVFNVVDQPEEEDFIPQWFRDFKKFDKSIAAAKPTIAEVEDES